MTTTIRLDQRTLALYGVGHEDYARQLRDALKPIVNPQSSLEIVPARVPDDATEFRFALAGLDSTDANAEKIPGVIESVWDSLPKTVIVEGKPYCVVPVEPGRFRISLQTRPEHAAYSGTWRQIQLWVQNPGVRRDAEESVATDVSDRQSQQT